MLVIMKRSHLLIALLLLVGVIITVMCLEASNDPNKLRNKQLEFIEKTPDVELLDAIHSKLAGKDVRNFNKSETAIYLVSQFQRESDPSYSGIYNSFTITYQDLPRAFRMIGANRHAKLAEKANRVYEKAKEKEERENGKKEEFTYTYYPELDEFEDSLIELRKVEDLWDLQTAYIRKHKSDFVDDKVK